MDGMIGFLLGAFMGSVFGFFIMALAVETKYHIRSRYVEYVSSLLEQDETIDVTSVKTFMTYVEKLFDYKNFDMLSEYICSIYHYAEVSISGKTMNIKAFSTDMFRDGKPNVLVLREIDKFSRNDTPISCCVSRHMCLHTKKRVQGTDTSAKTDL